MVEYLSYIMSPSSLTMAADKVKVIADWPTPQKVKDIQSFLGFTNFYRHFIFKYSEIILPLNWLTCKGIDWLWSADCQAAFDHLKHAFTTAPILAHWEPNQLLIVETDASDYAIAVILSILLDDSQIHPVAFLSWTYPPALILLRVGQQVPSLAIHTPSRVGWDAWWSPTESASQQSTPRIHPSGRDSEDTAAASVAHTFPPSCIGRVTACRRRKMTRHAGLGEGAHNASTCYI